MHSTPAIDPRIQRLKLTTFFGKRLTRRQIADVQEMVASLPGLSRNELGKTVCEHLGSKTQVRCLQFRGLLSVLRRDRQGRLLGCAHFEYASRKLACRDAWIGWQGAGFQRHQKRAPSSPISCAASAPTS